MQKTMSSDFRELVEQAENYEFDRNKLEAIPITGILRKSPNPRSCILVISSETTGDLVVELEMDDVIKHEGEKSCKPGGQVTLHVKPSAILTTSFRGKVTNPIVTSAVGQAVRQPIPSAPWRGIVSPFDKLDILLNFLNTIDWAECRARGKAECEQLHPPGPDRDRCITDRYIACGAPPRLRVDERTLEQLGELFRGPTRT